MNNNLRTWMQLAESVVSGRWYHGTGSLAQLRSIAAHGLQPRKSNYRGSMASVKHRIYLTASPVVAQVYSLRKQHNGKLAFIAEFSGADLINVHPDEDSIVRFLSNHTRLSLTGPPEFGGPDGPAAAAWRDLVSTLTPAQISVFRSRNFRGATQLAKSLLNTITRQTTDYLISNTFTVAVEGSAVPLACWVIPVGAITGMSIPPEAIRLEDFVQ